MSAVVVATAFGGPEVLAVIDEPVGSPGPGEVRIEVRAAGTNPADYKSYSGVFGTDPAKLPLRLGYEVSGVVAEVGAGAEGPAGPIGVGDEVVAYSIDGGYAAQIIAPGSAVLPKPTTLSFEQGSGLLLSGVTAAHTLVATAVAAGDTVVIHGASGGVGLMAVQLAVAKGARVIGTASESRHDYLRQLGAEPVTYGAGLEDRIRALAPDGVDAAIDMVGTDEAVEVSLALVADRSRIATIAAFGRAGKDGIKLLGGGPGADPGTDVRTAARLDLVREAEAGRLQVLLAASYPLDQVADAHRQLATGHANGKIVLTP
jgi:NADPH:quinone reductase-like Zn-dependent oxidoreductase